MTSQARNSHLRGSHPSSRSPRSALMHGPAQALFAVSSSLLPSVVEPTPDADDFFSDFSDEDLALLQDSYTPTSFRDPLPSPRGVPSNATGSSSVRMRSAFGHREAEYSRIVAKANNRLLDDLWRNKRIPEEGWSEHAIEMFLAWLASHDTNNRVDMMPIGAGEREGRVASALVQRLHCHLSHGVGRSGNLCEIQPKALGSSMLNCLGNELVLHAIRALGVPSCRGALVVPVATGMALSLCLGAWRRSKPAATHVLWLRVDQKSAFKAVLAAGYSPIIVEPKRDGDALVTDITAINTVLETRAEQILAVISTLSCFAPRAPDQIEAVAALARSHSVFHLVNNAYGLQSAECTRRLEAAREAGRVDAFVQSTDKNFRVPVGGAVIGFFKESQLNAVAKFYPGRASCVPARDLVITLLNQGLRVFLDGFERRKRLFEEMRRRLDSFASRIGEMIYDVPDNLISLAMTLSSIPPDKQTLFGSVLFNRGITGARVVRSTPAETVVEGFEFVNFGSHASDQHAGYLNIACAVGMTEAEVDELFVRLETAYQRFLRKTVRGSSRGDSPKDHDLDYDEED